MSRLLRTLIPPLALVLVALAPPLHAQYTFANIPWASTMDQADTALRGMGFTRYTAPDGEIYYKGTLDEQTAGVFVYPANGHVGMIAVVLLTEDSDAIDVYEDLRDHLTEKYGEPDSTGEIYERPYERGDGDTEVAIRVGKAHFVSMWMSPSGESLLIRIPDNLTVALHYESADWATESERLDKKRKSAF